MKDEDCEAHTQEQLASLKRDMRKSMEDATVRAMHKVMAEFEAKSDQRLMENAQGDLERIKLVQTGVGIGKPDYLAGVPPMLPQIRDGETIVVTEYAQPEQETVACPDGKQCKHGAWCTETYCQEHCEFRTPPANKPLSGYINRAGINANDSPITVVEKLERAIEASNQETQRKPLTSQERDAQRWRFLMENSYDSKSVTQFHVWEHSWEPHSQTGEPTEWKQRVRGIALIDFIDRAIEAAHGIKEKNT